MSQNQKCVICDNENPQWSTVDSATGFRMCSDCFSSVQDYFQRELRHRYQAAQTTDNVAVWLYSLAKVREAMVSKVVSL